jgi:hypothetical protein
MIHTHDPSSFGSKAGWPQNQKRSLEIMKSSTVESYLILIELTDIVVIFMDGDYGPLIFMIVWHFDSLKSMQDGLTP